MATQKFKSEVWPINKLHLWEKNPRNISDRDFLRLKEQIKKLGVYKPLICTEDGIILGGNMRFRALSDLGEKEIWVSIVDAPNEDAKLEYALSDNDRAGTYVETELMELLSKSEVDGTMFAADIGEPVLTADLLAMYGPSGESASDEAAKRLGVITIVPPEAPRLKEQITFRCSTKEQYDSLVEKFGEKPDINALLELLG